MSYRQKHVKSKIYKTRPRKPIFVRLWFWIFILILIIVSCAGYFILFYPGVQVKNFIISGNENVKTQDLQSVVSKYAHGSIFIINDKNIEDNILLKFPQIESASVNKKLPQTLVLNVIERKPIGDFCGSNNNCFSIDENGIIFGQVAVAPSGVLIVRQVGTSGQLSAGQAVVAKNLMDDIVKIQKSLKDNFKISIIEALIASSGQLNITTSEGWHIYFDISPDSDINLQVTKLNLLLSGGVSGASRKNLRYIDLRPKDRAIVCDNSTCGG